jgi:Domain of unknown function (DUF6265)
MCAMRTRRFLLLAVALLLAAPYAHADDAPLAYTRTAAVEAPRPKAELAELSWLVGQWQGPGINRAPSQETWSTALGGLMAGSFVQGDGKGGVMFSEFIQIAPDGESLIMRMKHFNADLTGWEEKDKFAAFRLIARERDIWYFNGLTYRREGRDRLLVAVRTRGNDGKSSELVFRFRRSRR